MPGANRKYVSLFSGCGGFDLGFSKAGFHAAAAYDIDPLAVENFRKNVSPNAYKADLRQGVPEDHRFRNINALIAGPPCQGFSTVGKRHLNDSRNDLLLLTTELAGRMRPDVVAIENVTGVVAGDHGRFWNTINDHLRIQGYRTAELRIRTADLGMGQVRSRMLMIAWRTSREVTFQVTKSPPQKLRDVLRGVSKAPNHSPRMILGTSMLKKIVRRIGPGQKLSNVRGGRRSIHSWDIPDAFGKTSEQERTVLELLLRLRRQERARSFGDADPVSLERLGRALGRPFHRILKSLEQKGFVKRQGSQIDLVRTFNGKCHRLDWDRPSCTVDTKFGDPWYFLHPSKDRAFTVREAARIQGFGDDYVFSGDLRSQYRLIGNAVPPPLGYHIGEIVAHLVSR